MLVKLKKSVLCGSIEKSISNDRYLFRIYLIFIKTIVPQYWNGSIKTPWPTKHGEKSFIFAFQEAQGYKKQLTPD